MRFAFVFLTLGVTSLCAGCALFFEDASQGAGGAGGAATSQSSAETNATGTGAGGAGGGGAGGTGGAGNCVGLVTEFDENQNVERWLRSFGGAEISGLARAAGQRLAFVGTSSGDSECGVEGLAPGPRLFYAELDEETGENLTVVDLGAAGDTVILISGGDDSGARVVWRSGSTLCAQPIGEMPNVQTSAADPCGANPTLRCSTTSSITELHAASTDPLVVGFRAAAGGTLSCLVPTGFADTYTAGQVLARVAPNASDARVFSTGEPLEQVRSSAVGGLAHEARVVGWCPANRFIAGLPCGGTGSYFQAFIGAATPDPFSLLYPSLLYPLVAIPDPRAGIHPHPRGFAFTSKDAEDSVLEWGTETLANPDVPIWQSVDVSADNAGAPARTEVLGATSVSPNGQALLVGQLSSAIPGATTCSPEWGTCAFVMRVDTGDADGVVIGLEAHVMAPSGNEAHAWATEAIYDGGFAGFIGGYLGGPLVHGTLTGNDAGDGKAAYIARGPVL